MSLIGNTTRPEVCSGLASILEEMKAFLGELGSSKGAVTFGHGVYSLPGGRLFATPRNMGESRYPQTRGGMNLWTCSSGYIHANNGLYSVFPRRSEGQEPPVAFFAATRKGDTWNPVSLMGVPHPPAKRPKSEGPFVLFTPNYTVYHLHAPGFDSLVRIQLLDAGKILFTVYMEGGDAPPPMLQLSSFFNPMLRHQIHETDEDRWFRQVSVHSPDVPGAATFRFQVNEDKDRYTSLSHFALVQRSISRLEGGELLAMEETPSRYQYMGSASRALANSLALRAGSFGDSREICTFTEPAIAGDLMTFTPEPGFRLRMDYLFQLVNEEEVADSLCLTPITNPMEWETDNTDERPEQLAIRFGGSTHDSLDGRVLTHFMEHLANQVEFCSLIRGYVQISENSLIGIRDIFQALEGLAYFNPSATREKMLEALDYTCPDGRSMRQYSLPKASGQIGRMDLRPFIDQGVWIINTVLTYLKLTGDRDFLHETCGYHRILDESSGRVERCEDEDTVLDHLDKIIGYLLRNLAPDTGCLRALYGDWNDALDGLGTLQNGDNQSYGDGVSVMATLQLYQNLHEMEEILQFDDPGAHGSQIGQLRMAAAKLSKSLNLHAIQKTSEDERRIVHGWGHQQGYHVGSFHDADGKARDSLTSNSFWVLSGMLRRTPELYNTILRAFDRLESPFGLKTFHPPFPENETRFGRIGKLPAGTAENGATYVHATAFAIMALFEMGEARRAWEELIRILPFTPGHDGLSHSPFVMPNSYGNNPARGIEGQNMNDWQTGSSNVVLKTILRHVIGFRMELDHLRLQPAEYSPFASWEVTLHARDRTFHVRYTNTGQKPRRFLVNGKPAPTTHDPFMKTDTTLIPLSDLNPGEVCEIQIEG
ncbi:MAG: hypothetical protein JJU11_12905 [Candidatus Sumerlaeia bacterium]|nr:hypothetical protein [Candidatus Sumerlaeia bacterium]